MPSFSSLPLVGEAELAEARRALGHDLTRIVGYFEEDGAKSIGRIKQALSIENAAGIVLPAHTLKGEARQLGALRLAALAEIIEVAARQCVEEHRSPREVAGEIALMRECFAETLERLKLVAQAVSQSIPQEVASEASPLARRPARPNGALRTFGRRAG